MNRPLDTELDRRMTAAIKARGPVEESVLRDEFDLCSRIVLVLGLIGAYCIFCI